MCFQTGRGTAEVANEELVGCLADGRAEGVGGVGGAELQPAGPAQQAVDRLSGGGAVPAPDLPHDPIQRIVRPQRPPEYELCNMNGYYEFIGVDQEKEEPMISYQVKISNAESYRQFWSWILFCLLSIFLLQCDVTITPHSMKLELALKAARWQMDKIREAEEECYQNNSPKGYVELSTLVSGKVKFDGVYYYAGGYSFRVVLQRDADNIARKYYIVCLPVYKDRLPHGLIMNETGNTYIFDYPNHALKDVPDSYLGIIQFISTKCRQYTEVR
jgi:hypothetical protein